MARAASRETHWNLYVLYVDLYKHYMELVLKFNVFHYAITGAIVSFYFAAKGGIPLIRYSLFLPFAMSVSLVVLFGWGALLVVPETRREVLKIGEKLGFTVVTEFTILQAVLLTFAVLSFLTAAGLALLYMLASSPPRPPSAD
jgi:hypothetical protein